MKPVKIAWNKFTQTRVTMDLAAVVDEPLLSEFLRKAEGARHPAYQLADDLFVEIPAADWGHGELLVYLPSRGWLVRCGGITVHLGMLTWAFSARQRMASTDGLICG